MMCFCSNCVVCNDLVQVGEKILLYLVLNSDVSFDLSSPGMSGKDGGRYCLGIVLEFRMLCWKRRTVLI